MGIISPEPAHPSKHPLKPIIGQAVPFSQDWITLSKEEYINLTQQANYWKAQHALLKQKNTKLEDEVQYLKGKVKDLQNRVFGKKSEKKGVAIFAKACFGHPSPSKRQKLDVTTYASGGPDLSSSPHPHGFLIKTWHIYCAGQHADI